MGRSCDDVMSRKVMWRDGRHRVRMLLGVPLTDAYYSTVHRPGSVATRHNLQRGIQAVGAGFCLEAAPVRQARLSPCAPSQHTQLA